MSSIWVRAYFTQNNGDDPATGLALADIDMYLTSVNRSTGAASVIWDGSQNPTVEETDVGAYGRLYGSADFETYHYFGGGRYTGGVGLDSDWSSWSSFWGPTPTEVWGASRRTLTLVAATRC